MALALLIGIPGGYAIARLPFVGRRQVSGLFLAAYLFPAILMAIPLFVLFTRAGLRGQLPGLILVYTAQTVPVAIYMLRNYFETVPVWVEEAGMMDGLGRIGVLRKISLRLALPSVMATGLFVFMIAGRPLQLDTHGQQRGRDRRGVAVGRGGLRHHGRTHRPGRMGHRFQRRHRRLGGRHGARRPAAARAPGDAAAGPHPIGRLRLRQLPHLGAGARTGRLAEEGLAGDPNVPRP